MNTDIENNKISTSTIVRGVIFALAIINQILVSTGHSVLPVSDDQLTEFITLIFTVGTSLWGYWKNNSFTKAAIEADKLLQELKNQE